MTFPYKVKIFFYSLISIITTIWLLTQIFIETFKIGYWILLIFPLSIIISLCITISKKFVPHFLTTIRDTSFDNKEILKNRVLELKKLFRKSNIVLVCGLSGIGKTTLAKCFLENRLKKYHHIAWIDCESNLKNSFVTNTLLIENLNIDIADHAPMNNDLIDSYFFKILNGLNKLKGKNLLVIDDALQNKVNNFFLTNNFLSSSWDILITSKEKGPIKKCVYDFSFYKLEDLRKLFYHYNDEHRDDVLVNEIIQKVGFHTFAVELIAKILQNNRSLDLKQVNNKLDQEGLKLSSSIHLNTQYDKIGKNRTNFSEGMIKAFSIIDELTTFDKYILDQFSVLPSINFTYNELIELLSIKKNIDGFNNSLNTLNAYNLINETRDGFKCHQIVQKVISHSSTLNFDKYETLVINLVEKLEYDPLKNRFKLMKYLHCAENILKKLNFSNALIANLAHNVNDYFESIGEYKKALYYVILAIRIRRKILDENSLDLAQSHNNIAVTLMKLNKLSFARKFLKASLDVRKYKLNQEDILLAQSYNNWGYLEYLRKNYNEAEIYFEKALSIYTYSKKLPQNERVLIEYAKTYSNLSSCYVSTKKYSEAINMLLESQKILNDLKGAYSIDTIEVNLSLGSLYFQIGNYKKASKLYKDNLINATEVFGKYHPFVSRITESLSIINKKGGNFIKSKKYSKDFLKIEKKLNERRLKTLFWSELK